METNRPHLFHYSLDWRFLIPAGDVKKVYLLSEEDTGLAQALERVGIGESQRLSFSDLQQNKKYDFQSLVMPFGLPAGWMSVKDKDRIPFYVSLRQFIGPGRFLLVGFNSIWNVRASSNARYYASTPRRITAQLKQAGFSAIKIFGVMPNLAIPEYVFDLEPETTKFALYNRFRRKPAVLRAVRLLAGTLGWRNISHLLPCYFAVAVA